MAHNFSNEELMRMVLVHKKSQQSFVLAVLVSVQKGYEICRYPQTLESFSHVVQCGREHGGIRPRLGNIEHQFNLYILSISRRRFWMLSKSSLEYMQTNVRYCNPQFPEYCSTTNFIHITYIIYVQALSAHQCFLKDVQIEMLLAKIL